MANTYKAPGVYVEEQQLPPSIVGVGTSTGGFVGKCESTSSEMDALLITSFTEYRSNFGGFSAFSSDTNLPGSYISYAVYAFFQQGGTQCYIVNTNVSSGDSSDNTDTPPPVTTPPDPGKKAFLDIQSLVKVEAKSPGTQGNDITVRIKLTGGNMQFFVNGDVAGSGTNNVSTVTGITNDDVTITALSGVSGTEKFANLAETHLAGGENSADGQKASLTENGLIVTAKTAGTAGNSISITIEKSNVLAPMAFKANGTQYGNAASTFNDLKDSVNADSSNTVVVLSLASPSDGSSSVSETVGPVNLSGGVDPANPQPQPDPQPTPGGDDSLWTQLQKGMDVYETIDDVNLLLIPDVCLIPSDTLTTALKAILSFCSATKQDLFFIGDVPSSDTNYNNPTQLANFVTDNDLVNFFGFGSIYYPYVQISNPALLYSDSGDTTTPPSNIWMPSSGAVAGNYAATDGKVGVYKAPAGLQDGQIALALSAQVRVTETQLGNLNYNGVNLIKSFPGYGPVIWGARTTSLQTSPQAEWKYVPVRRLFIYVEQSIKQSIRWVVFEPNTPKLWGTLTRDISAFLNTLWQEGGLSGSKASDAYFVDINEENNPPEQISNGYLNINIGIAPVFPAEFVVIKIGQKTLSS